MRDSVANHYERKLLVFCDLEVSRLLVEKEKVERGLLTDGCV